MERPKILENRFEPGMDKPINSAVLRAIFDILEVNYDRENDRFTSSFGAWAVRIEDQHDKNESEPHYILMVGEGDYEAGEKHSFEARYCDYYSTTNIAEQILDKVPEEGTIKENPGRWRIYIWLPENYRACAQSCAEFISQAYADVMKEVLPDYFIPCSSVARIDG